MACIGIFYSESIDAFLLNRWTKLFSWTLNFEITSGKVTETCIEIEDVLKIDGSQAWKSPSQENNLVHMFEDMTNASVLYEKKATSNYLAIY